MKVLLDRAGIARHAADMGDYHLAYFTLAHALEASLRADPVLEERVNGR